MTEGKDTYQDKHLFLRFIKATSPHCTPETDIFFPRKRILKKKGQLEIPFKIPTF